jgi:hypothetical protein
MVEGQVHALRGFEDEADDEAGCAARELSSPSIRAFRALLADTSTCFAKLSMLQYFESLLGLSIERPWLWSF